MIDKFNGEVDPVDRANNLLPDIDDGQYIAVTYESDRSGNRVHKVGKVISTNTKRNPRYREVYDHDNREYEWESGREMCIYMECHGDDGRVLYIFLNEGQVFSKNRYNNRAKMYVGDLKWIDPEAVVA